MSKTARAIVHGLLSFEAIFVLYITSGIYKATPLFSWMPVDVTMFTGALTIGAGTVVLARGNGVPVYTLAVGALVSAWLGWTAVTAAWSTSPEVALGRATLGLPLVLLSFVGSAFVVASDEARVVRFLRLFAWCGLLFVVITFYNVLVPGDRSAAEASNYIPRGIALAIAAAVMFIDAVSPNRPLWYRVTATGLGLLYAAAVLAAGSRQALAALLLTLPFLAALGWRVSAGRRGVALAALLTVLAGALVGVLQFGDELVTLRRLEVVLSGQLGASLSARADHLQSALNGFEDAPIVGHGLAAFGQLYGLTISDYPHNIVAEVLFEAGLIGLCLLLLTVGALALATVRGRHQLAPFARYAVLSAIVIVAVNAMVSGTFTENRLLWGIAGLAVVASGKGPAACRS